MKTPDFPSTRAEAIERLRAFLPQAPKYANQRNEVRPDHENVSRLSPALRTRALRERDVVAAVLERHPLDRVEKFVQEVYWRLYWKSWLERRPSVWHHYRESLGAVSNDDRERAERLMAGESGVAIMDHFARELAETGYLHNHARMWFAGFWIHTERVPWQLGAEFFHRHLRDADAASNTLSWRWVAGLHTPGKNYLARRSNLERNVFPGLLETRRAGLERLEHGEPWMPGENELANPSPEKPGDAPFSPDDLPERWGLWIHDEDLSLEDSELGELRPSALLATDFLISTDGECKRRHLEASVADGLDRAALHFGIRGERRSTKELADAISAWATEQHLDAVVALRPHVGSIGDELDEIRKRLIAADCDFRLVRRADDAATLPLATGGFFGFWKKARRLGFDSGSPSWFPDPAVTP